jgi:hypothetical protein
MTWLQGQDPTVMVAASTCALLVFTVVLFVGACLRRASANAEPAATSRSATPPPWPPGADEHPEPYQLYFEQLNSMLEPVEPFSLDQFKANCSLPSPPMRVRFTNEGGFITEPALQDGAATDKSQLA